MQETSGTRSLVAVVGARHARTRRLLRIAAAASMLLAGAASPQSFRSALDCETTVKSTYWQLRSDGKAGPFPYAKYRDLLAQRAERTAPELEYVREHRGRDLDAQELQGEIDRIERDTKSPDALKKLFAALGNDPQLR